MLVVEDERERGCPNNLDRSSARKDNNICRKLNFVLFSFQTNLEFRPCNLSFFSTKHFFGVILWVKISSRNEIEKLKFTFKLGRVFLRLTTSMP